jgi:hypothetical protein
MDSATGEPTQSDGSVPTSGLGTRHRRNRPGVDRPRRHPDVDHDRYVQLLEPNSGYLPPSFTVQDYQDRALHISVVGGAVVSGSFQGFDQTYLLDALHRASVSRCSMVSDPPRRTLTRTARTPACASVNTCSSVTVTGNWVTPTKPGPSRAGCMS